MKFVTAGLCAIAVVTTPVFAQASPEAVAKAALEAAPVFDGHNDMPIQVRVRFANLLKDFDFEDTLDAPENPYEAGPMQTDLARLRKGMLGAQFWSVYVSYRLPEPEAVRMTLEQIDLTKRIIARYPDDLQLALSADDVEDAVSHGRIASMIGMEGGHSIGSSLAVLRQMYDLGARYLTLAHYANTPWSDSASVDPEHGGLTDFGRDVVREMNRIGMVVDLAHVSEDTMNDALDVARAPVIFSHSGARAIDGHARNVPDSVLRRLKDNGGIVMAIAYPGFVSEPLRQWIAKREAEQARLKSLWQGQPERVKQGLESWEAANPTPIATVSDVADHIDHIREVAGVEHIGIGGDYDGIPTGVAGMEDVSGYPALFTELARRGYSQAELEMISMRNMLRVLHEVEKYAASQRDAPPIETLFKPD